MVALGVVVGLCAGVAAVHIGVVEEAEWSWMGANVEIAVHSLLPVVKDLGGDDSALLEKKSGFFPRIRTSKYQH